MSSLFEGEHRKPPRKINRVLPQLKRNAACIPCRRRRIKCDAGKPHCSSCVKSYKFLARSQPNEERDAQGVQCFYEDCSDDETPSYDEVAKKRKEHAVGGENPAVPGRKLEARVFQAELMDAFNRVTSSSTQSSSPSDLRPLTTSTGTDSNAVASHPLDKRKQFVLSPTGDSQLGNGLFSNVSDTTNGLHHIGRSANRINGVDGVSQPTPAPAPQPAGFQDGLQPPVAAGQVSTTDYDAESGRIVGQLLDVFWPGWPPRLPTPSMLDHLVYTFFSMVPSVPRLLHQTTFKARLSLPPAHPDFPHPALLHAICCVTARYSAAVKVESIQESVERIDRSAGPPNGPGRRTVEDEIAAETCFAERNAKYAVLEMRYNNPSGGRMFEILQAQVILGLFHQQTGRWLDGWLFVGQTVRSAIPLGLMNNEDPSEFHIPRLRPPVLPPPVTDWEREERRLLIYYILANDASFSVSAAWPGSMMFDELTVRMPASKSDYDRGYDIPENPQTYHSPDLFTNHPVSCSMVMFMKSMIILGRVSKLTRKLRLLPPSERVMAKRWPEAHKVDRDIADLVRTWPTRLRDPMFPLEGTANRIDADLVCAHLVCSVAAIHLHEPFADLSGPQCPHSARLLKESRDVLKIVQSLVNSNTDVSFQMIPISSLWVFTAARTLLLFYHRALEQTDHETAASILSEIEVFQMLFASMGSRFVMGAIHCGMIDRIVKHIHSEFGFPIPHWRWTPADWVQEGVERVHDGVSCPNTLGPGATPINPPDAHAQGQEQPSISSTSSGGNVSAGQNAASWKYRDLADIQRGYLGRAVNTQQAQPHAAAELRPLTSHQPLVPPHPPQLPLPQPLPSHLYPAPHATLNPRPSLQPHAQPHDQQALTYAPPMQPHPASSSYLTSSVHQARGAIVNPVSSGSLDFGALSMGNAGIGLGRDGVTRGVLGWLDWDAAVPTSPHVGAVSEAPASGIEWASEPHLPSGKRVKH